MGNEKEILQRFSSEVWGLVLLRGIAALALGVLLLTKTGITVLILVQFLGAFYLVDGIFTIVKSVNGHKFVKGWRWGIFVGILEILAGVVVFGHPIISTIFTVGFLVYFISFMAVFFGISGIITGVSLRKEIKGEWSMIIGGLLAIIFGVLLMVNPEASAISLILIMGIFAIVGGISHIFHAFSLYKVGKKG